jgi:hypothetical protein
LKGFKQFDREFHLALLAGSQNAFMPQCVGRAGARRAVVQVSATKRHLGIRDWLRSHSKAIQPVHTARRAYVTDVDTPDDLATPASPRPPQPRFIQLSRADKAGIA